jgi:hypothetical protein
LIFFGWGGGNLKFDHKSVNAKEKNNFAKTFKLLLQFCLLQFALPDGESDRKENRIRNNSPEKRIKHSSKKSKSKVYNFTIIHSITFCVLILFFAIIVLIFATTILGTQLEKSRASTDTTTTLED